MTTGEFIKMLQEADPEGTSHVRLCGDGVPTGAQRIEGYWDGAYTYIDKEGNYVTSHKGSKVDIYTQDMEEFIYDKVINEKMTWEEIEPLIKFELGYVIKAQRDERIKQGLANAKRHYDEASQL